MGKFLKLMKWIFTLLGVLFLIAIGNPVVSKATADKSFNVSPVLPKNQLKTTNSYYDLLVKPGMTQELELKVFNHSDQDETYVININPATTNENGILDYTTKDKKYQFDSSLTIPVTALATIENNEIKIPAKKSEIVKIKVEIPKEGIKGLVVGGIRTSIKNEREAFGNEDSSSMKITNEINYNIGLNLRMEENPKVNAELKLVDVKAASYNGRNVFSANIQNSEAMVLNDIDYAARIYNEDGKEVLFERFISGLRMAPNSNFNYNISLENARFKAGNYRIEMTAESKETKQKWQWTKNFNVTKEKANQLNDEAIDLEDSYWWLYLLIGFMVIAILVLVIIVIALKKKTKQKRQRKRKKSKNQKKVQRRSTKNARN